MARKANTDAALFYDRRRILMVHAVLSTVLGMG